MKPEFRIVRDEQGYFLETMVAKWTLFGIREKWEPYIYCDKITRRYPSYASAKRSFIMELEFYIFNAYEACPITREIPIKK